MKIVLCYPVETKHLRQIQALMPDAEVVDAGQKRIAEALFEADIFCGHAKVPVDWDGVVRQGRLRWVQSSAAGMDHCLVPSVVASDLVVTSASGLLADQVAEHTIALMTGWCRSLPAFFRAQQRKDFTRLPTRDLHRSTVGIVGFGGVGRRLARLVSMFRTRILATDMFPLNKPDYVENLWPAERLDELLSQSNIVVLALPLNEMTRGILNAGALARMQRGSLLVNVARGPLVVTGDLIEALRGGTLAGAVMDVTDPEPLPPDNPLWDMPNVIITPHVGGQSATRQDDVTRLFCENLKRWKHGEPLINYLSDKKLGFPIRGPGSVLWADVVDGLPPFGNF
jgi:phosphoglycerate dehydrogenase-like enzyme